MEKLTQQEKQDLQDILVKLYGNQARQWEPEIKTFQIMGAMIEKTKKCSDLMDMIPRPFGGSSAINWGRKQMRDFLIRKFKGRDGRFYISCLNTTKYVYRARLQSSAMGL